MPPCGSKGHDDPMEHLPRASGVSFNSSKADPDEEAGCLAGTRRDVLEQIQSWADGPSPACIFWVNGMAGRGKSTVARTIARAYDEKKRLGASFFFSRRATEANKPTKLFTTIAFQLAALCPSLIPAIARAVADNKDVGSETLHDQWEKLIHRPLSGLQLDQEQSSATSPVVVVIDALDECESQHAIIVSLLAKAMAIAPVRLRIVITSRPETPITHSFGSLPERVYRQLSLDNVPRETVDRDIFHFYTERFRTIADCRSPSGWPGNTKIDRLVKKADGLFIYAATVCRFIQKKGDLWLPDRLLAVFLPEDRSEGVGHAMEHIPSTSPTAGLDNLYLTILERVMEGLEAQDKEQLSRYFSLALGYLVLLYEPFSTAALAKLLGSDEGMLHRRLLRLRSVLNVPEDPQLPIQILHTSFRDFLTSKSRCLEERYQVDPVETHQRITESCLGCLSGLRRDIVSLRFPGARVEAVDPGQVSRHLPSHMQYACVYWVQHLIGANTPVQDHQTPFRFLKEHFLHWLEALSVIRKFSTGIEPLYYLDAVVTVSVS